MNVPGWLLRIILGFLTDRRLEITYQGGRSQQKPMPGGGPAGTTLGLLMFVVLINNTANPGPLTNWGHILTKPIAKRKPVTITHAKMIDDVSLAEALDLESDLVPKDEKSLIRPLTRRERFELTIPPSSNKTLSELTKMLNYAKMHYMKMNPKKTKVLMFNPERRQLDFKPELDIEGNPIDVIDKYRLVGYVLSDDLSWESNTESLTNRAYARMWIIRRVKALGG